MRISDDRYHRERERMELALRFLRHEARTQTIRAWTGLSDDRIRKLYRSYLGDARRELPRHRGKSPHQIAISAARCACRRIPWRSRPACGCSACCPARASRRRPARSVVLTRGALLCKAFEAYRLARSAALISFEHAVFLAGALGRGEQLRLGWCADCGGLIVTEPCALRVRRCQHCAGAAGRTARIRRHGLPRRTAFMDQHRPNFLSGPYIDRRAEAREDEHWIAQARADRRRPAIC